MTSAFKPLSGNGRRADAPGAKVMGNDCQGENAPRQAQDNTNPASNARGANMGNVLGSKPRNFRGTDTRIFRGSGFRRPQERGPAFELTTHDWNEISGEAFRKHMQEEGLTVKEIAQEIGCNDRTAENYVQGRNAPAGVHLLRSLATIPTFAAAVRELTGMQSSLDPRAQHRAMKLMQEASRFLDSMGASQDADEGDDTDTDEVTGDLFERVRH